MSVRFFGRSTYPLVAAALTTLVAVAPALAQGATRNFTKPIVELAEPYTSISGVRELSDGRVIVTDPQDKVVHLVNLKTKRVQALSREGSGPNEFQLPMRAFALPGDSTLIPDPLNARFLLLGPAGKLAGTWSPAAPPAPPAPAGSRAGGQVMMMGGAGMMAIVNTRSTDAAGRLYSAGSAVSMGPGGPQAADSVPVLRSSRVSGASDETVAWIVPTKPVVSGGGGNVNVRMGADPFPVQDGWAVFPDGRVIVVRAKDYHVEVFPASGKGAPVIGPARSLPAIRVTEAEKQAWRDGRKSSGGIALAVTNENGRQSTRAMSPGAAGVQDPDSWPATLPAFQASQVYALPNGEIWVGRYSAASDKSIRFDVFNAQGRFVDQVVFAPRTRVVGFGKGTVYTARLDEDDLQYLQQFRLP